MKASYRVEKVCYRVELILVKMFNETGNNDCYYRKRTIVAHSGFYDSLEKTEAEAQEFKNKLNRGWYGYLVQKGENYRAKVCFSVYHVTEQGFKILFDAYEF